MFWIRSCKTLLGEADTAKKFQSNMLAEMMLALTDLCEHFCSTWPSVVVGVCVCVCASSLCVCVHWPTQILLFFFPSSVQTTQILISCFPTHILTTVWFTPASNKQQPLNSPPRPYITLLHSLLWSLLHILKFAFFFVSSISHTLLSLFVFDNSLT